MLDTKTREPGHGDGETTLKGKTAGSSPAEPNKISEIKWKRRIAEQPEDVPYATPAEDPYAKVGEEKRAKSLIAESDNALVADNVALQRLMLSLPAIKGDINGRGGPLLLNEYSFVSNPPEETRLMAVLYKDQEFGHEELHHGLKPADFVAINAVLVLANTNRDDKLGWSKDGLVGKAKDILGKKAIDPVKSVQDAVGTHIAERKGRYERSFDAKDVLTMRGFDACVATALGSGDLKITLSLLEGAHRLFPENTTAVADAATRHLPSIRKAYEMYPLELKRQADAIFASMTPREFQGLLGVSAIVELQKESTQKLRASAMIARDRWYGAQQACGRPEELRRQIRSGDRVDEALKHNTSWESMVQGLSNETSAIVDAQVANVIAAELARRVHPERTIAAHMQTDIQRLLVDPAFDGASFDPKYGSQNEYVALYGAYPADSKPQLDKPRTIDALTRQQRVEYFAHPDRLDVAAFLRFFSNPSIFIGQEQVSSEVAVAMVDHFVPGIQFLYALVYSGKGGALNQEVHDLIQRQFGIDVVPKTCDAAQMALKKVAPSSPVVTLDAYELMVTRNLPLPQDQATLKDIQAIVPQARAYELDLAEEDLRQALQKKKDFIAKARDTAQKYLSDIAKAQQDEAQAQVDQKRLKDELAKTEVAKVGKGFAGIGRGQYDTQADKDRAIQECKDQIKNAEDAAGTAASELLRLKGFEDLSTQKQREVESCDKQIARLQRLLDDAMPKK